MFVALPVFGSHLAMAALVMATSCNGGPCVSVYTDPTTHQIVITANQNTPGSTSTPAHPKPTHAPRPVVKRSSVARPRPKPVTWIPYAPKPYVPRVAPKYTYKPKVLTQVAKKKSSTIAAITTTAVNLSDQITQLLPGNHLLYQPVANPLSGVPVYFWSDAGTIFSVVTSILGIGVTVALQPSFSWNFGDGTGLTVSNPGGPYPNKTVVHTYTQPGQYTASLAISWAGTWAAQGSVLPVLGGAIVQNVSAEITVSPGPTNYTG